MEPGGCWQGLCPEFPSHYTHLCMNAAMVSKRLSTANIGAGDLGREAVRMDWDPQKRSVQ